MHSKPATQWVMLRLVGWTSCPVLALLHYDNTLEIPLPANSAQCGKFMLPLLLLLSDSPAVFLHTLLGVYSFFWLQNITPFYYYYSCLCAADKKTCFSLGVFSVSLKDFGSTSVICDTVQRLKTDKQTWYKQNNLRLCIINQTKHCPVILTPCLCTVCVQQRTVGNTKVNKPSHPVCHY